VGSPFDRLLLGMDLGFQAPRQAGQKALARHDPDNVRSDGAGPDPEPAAELLAVGRAALLLQGMTLSSGASGHLEVVLPWTAALR
ncbi:MAG TPA: hypothetical protein RMF84_03390, partial [Polyangiaceae bacterium LLY-WYZ-14_1]|nr:hypothetical protein [Polyangiaceae bacterium LLY-WYZ-14_1]